MDTHRAISRARGEDVVSRRDQLITSLALARMRMQHLLYAGSEGLSTRGLGLGQGLG